MLQSYVFVSIFLCAKLSLSYRVFLKLSELAVLGTPLDVHLMNFFSDLVFLLLKLWKESKFVLAAYYLPLL